jgi:hypothetical protein
MKTAADLDYRLHHLCIYDDKPRDNMWPYLRWHHGLTNYFSGAVFHVTGEGHSDYTFLGCGGRAYQVQIEAPPFQFEYERNWWADHGRGPAGGSSAAAAHRPGSGRRDQPHRGIPQRYSHHAVAIHPD